MSAPIPKILAALSVVCTLLAFSVDAFGLPLPSLEVGPLSGLPAGDQAMWALLSASLALSACSYACRAAAARGAT